MNPDCSGFPDRKNFLIHKMITNLILIFLSGWSIVQQLLVLPRFLRETFKKRSTADVCTHAGNVSHGPRSAAAKDQLQ